MARMGRQTAKPVKKERMRVLTRLATKIPTIPAEKVVNTLISYNCVPGFPVSRYYNFMDDVLLLACTENNTRQQIGFLAETIGGLL